jgi:autotransporter-associated beta strand protein
VSVNGGALNIANSFTAPILVGNGTGAAGVLNVQPGANINAVVNAASPNIGAGSGSSSVGAVYQSGGSVTFDAQLLLGSGLNSHGFYNLTGGTLTTTGTANNRLRIGGQAGGATGIFYQTGGAITLVPGSNGIFEVGANQGGGIIGATGVAYLTGGTVTSAQENRIGYDPTTGSIRGEETIAGTAAVTINQITTLGRAASDVGILNLNGGSYATKQIVKGASGVGMVNFNGGILKAAASATAGTFFTGLTSATVFSGGATVDTNGQNLTIGQSLSAPAGSGVATIAVANGGIGYVGAPYIAISGGGGTGATAVANMTDDGTGGGTFKIASITITSPGTSYTSAPTVAVTGGGGTGAILGSVATAANVSGGFTKSGLGTLNLSGSSTYTGPTIVTSGTLLLTGSVGGTTTVQASNSTVELGAADRINDAADITLTAATINTASFSETVGQLSLGTGVSVLDLGAAGLLDFHFAASAAQSWTGSVSIFNWTAGNDHVFFGSDSSALLQGQLDGVNFYSDAGLTPLGTAAFAGGGEIVPVPEPTSSALLWSGLGLAIGWKRLRRQSAGRSLV